MVDLAKVERVWINSHMADAILEVAGQAKWPEYDHRRRAWASLVAVATIVAERPKKLTWIEDPAILEEYEGNFTREGNDGNEETRPT